MSTIELTGLATEIAKIIGKEEQRIVAGISKKELEISKKGVKTLKETSPKDRGKYASTWKRKETKQEPYPSTTQIYNQKNYPLAHILENGYVTRSGKRTKPQPHIAPVEESIIKEFEEEVKAVIQSDS